MNGKKKIQGKEEEKWFFQNGGVKGKTSMLYKRHVSTIGERERNRERGRGLCLSPSSHPPAHDATILFPGVAMTVGSIKGKEEVEEQNRFPIPQPGAPITSRRRGLSGAAARRLGGPLPHICWRLPLPCLKAFPFPTRVGVMDRSNPPSTPVFSLFLFAIVFSSPSRVSESFEIFLYSPIFSSILLLPSDGYVCVCA